MERPISIRLPAELLDEIDRRARRRRRRRSDVIREALARFLELPEGVLDGRPAERVRDLIGSVGRLPADLSSHPRRYLADFGRGRG